MTDEYSNKKEKAQLLTTDWTVPKTYQTREKTRNEIDSIAFIYSAQ
jgi:hypothetical protein